MKIIEPSAHIEELPENIYQRIDKAASVCYQRPAKPTVEEAMEFCRGMIKRKHWMPLEFATVHLAVPQDMAEEYEKEKFLDVWFYQEDESIAIISGSARAWLEIEGEFGSWIWGFLAQEFPLFFTATDRSHRGNIRLAQPHEIPWQHEHVAVRVVCNRAISHQLVRHRPCSILQESQRYCRYDGERFDGEITVIQPEWFSDRAYMGGSLPEHIWHDKCANAEQGYICLLNNGKTPQQARDVLPNSCKTELIMYASLPEWQHILDTDTMRCSPHADPEMRRIMEPLREEFMARWPEVLWR